MIRLGRILRIGKNCFIISTVQQKGQKDGESSLTAV